MGNRLHQLKFTSRVIYRKMRLTRTFLKMPTTGRLSEGSDPSWAGIRSLTTTIHLPPWMIILFAGSRTKPAGKVSVRLPVDEWLCRKFERLNVTVAEGYLSRNSETGGLLRDKFVKTPRSSKWYAMLLQLYVTGLRNRPNSTVPLPEWPDRVCLLPLLPALLARTR